jgi:NitT/TauT family transport system ATP-binding protein
MNREQSVPMMELRGVSKRYGNGVLVLDAIDMEIAKGEFVSIVGPSGCGKSTVLKLISGLAPPTSGKIQVDGMTPKDAREIVSYIFQDPTLLPWRTVRQNVGLGIELDRAASPQRRAKPAELLELVGLTHVAEAYPRELSGGMKMRVSIARALATSPRLLLMDEPFAALDEMTRDRLNEEVLRLREEQKWTAVFVTHSVTEAVFLSTRIIVLRPNPGRIHACFPVCLPKTRNAALRSTPEFDAMVLKVSHALREALTQ